MAEDGDFSVRLHVAANANTPIKTLIALSHEDNMSIRKRSTENLEASFKIPFRVGNVAITSEQRAAVLEGKTIALSNVRDKQGSVYDTVNVAFDFQADKIKLSSALPEKSEKVQARRELQQHPAAAREKKAGLRM
jgi:hypothetical protein